MGLGRRISTLVCTHTGQLEFSPTLPAGGEPAPAHLDHNSRAPCPLNAPPRWRASACTHWHIPIYSKNVHHCRLPGNPLLTVISQVALLLCLENRMAPTGEGKNKAKHALTNRNSDSLIKKIAKISFYGKPCLIQNGLYFKIVIF